MGTGAVRGLARSSVVVAVAALYACSTTATITRSDGVNVEGRIQGGTRDEIVVDPNVGRRQIIPRRDITEIDHPGNVHVIIGGIVVGYGGFVIANGVSECRNSNQDGSCALLLVPALTGLAIAGWGLATWLGSKNAAEDTTMKLPPREERIGPRRGLPPPEGMLPPPPANLPPPTLPAVPSALPAAPSAAPPASPAPAPSSTAPSPPPEQLPPPGVDW